MIRGDFSKLRRFEQTLRALPRTVAIEVATQSAGAITALGRATFHASENAFGDSWKPGAKGQRVTLERTGTLAAGIRYVAIGTRLRAVLGPAYARYQVGARPVFPRGPLPVEYVAVLRANVAAAVARHLGGV